MSDSVKTAVALADVLVQRYLYAGELSRCHSHDLMVRCGLALASGCLRRCLASVEAPAIARSGMAQRSWRRIAVESRLRRPWPCCMMSKQSDSALRLNEVELGSHDGHSFEVYDTKR